MPLIGELMALAAAVTWAASVVLFKRSDEVDAQGMNLFKNVVAMTLLIATLPIVGESIDMQRSTEDWVRLIASGILGIAIADTLVFMSLKRLGAGLLAVVDCAYAPVMVAMSVLVLGEEVGVGFGAGAVLVVGGVLLATMEQAKAGAGPTIARRDLKIGLLCGVFGILAMASGVVLVKPVLERGMLFEITLIRLIAGVVAQLLWVGVVPGQKKVLEVFRPAAVWRTLVPASILGSYVSMLFWLGGFKYADASVAAVLNQLSAVFTIILARLVLSERLTRQRALGAMGAFLGSVMILAWP